MNLAGGTGRSNVPTQGILSTLRITIDFILGKKIKLTVWFHYSIGGGNVLNQTTTLPSE